MPEVFPDAPANWGGSKPEWAIYWALTQLKLQEGVDFSYQVAWSGGRQERGGMVIDFYIWSLNLGISIQSVYYHYANTTDRGIDEMNRAQAEAGGLTMVYIDEEDALRNPIYYAKEALAGRDYSRMTGR